MCWDHLNSDVVEAIVQYFYTGEVKMELQQMKDAMEVCEFLHVKELKSPFMKYILQQISVDNCVEWYIFGDKFALKECRAVAKSIMCTQFVNATKVDEFKCLSMAELIVCIKHEDIALPNRNAVLRACMKWVQHDHHARQDTLPHVLRHVLLEKCSLNCLKDVFIEFKELLTSAELRSLFTDAQLYVSNHPRLVIVGGTSCGNDNDNIWYLDYPPAEDDWQVLSTVPASMTTSTATICHGQHDLVLLGGERAVWSTVLCCM